MTVANIAIIGGTVIGGVLSSRAAGDAADAQSAGADRSIAEQRRQYDQTRQDNEPWRQAGMQSLNRLNAAGGGDMSQFQTSPGYQFRVDEGNRNVENRFSVGGGGGNAMKALTEYNQNLASNEYGTWWNQQAGMAGVGQAANAQNAAYGANSANNISNAYLSQGNARASGINDAAAGWNNALQGGIGNYLYYRGNKSPAVDPKPELPPSPWAPRPGSGASGTRY